MTSAWAASFLGVAGTLIGAAVGSLIATTAAALYKNSLEHGKTLLATGKDIQHADGADNDVSTTSATQEVDQTHTSRTIGSSNDSLGKTSTTVLEQEPNEPVWKRLNWKIIAASTAVVLVLTLAFIATFEQVSGRSFGNESNPTISRPWQSTSSTETPVEPTETDPTATPTESADPAATPTPTEAEPTQTAETPEPTPTAQVTPAPTTAATPVPQEATGGAE